VVHIVRFTTEIHHDARPFKRQINHLHIRKMSSTVQIRKFIVSVNPLLIATALEMNADHLKSP